MRPRSNLSQPRHRALALILSVSALAFLLLATAMTTQAFVARIRETTLDDFASGEFYRTGLLDIAADPPTITIPIDSIQLLPIGLFGQWQEDVDHPLPVAVTELSAVAAGQHVVVIGGFDANHNHRDEVYVSAIDAQGGLGGWVEQTYPLPHPMSAGAAVAYPKDNDSSWIYVLGGIGPTGPYTNVYRTTLDHNTGTIGPWITNTQPLSMPLYYLDAVAHNGYLYVVGGYTEDPPWFYAVKDVFYTRILADGSLEPWQSTESLPEALSSHLVVAYSEEGTNTLYAIGGWDQTGAANSSFRVYFADINPDGSLSPWVLSDGNLPSKIYAHGGAIVSAQIIVTGGKDSTNTVSDTVKAALVDPGNPTFRLYDWCEGVPPPSCTIGAWQTGPLLPEPRAFHITVEDEGFVYTLGGVDADGNPTASIYWGRASVPGALYSPWGHYISSEFDFSIPATLYKLEWGATMGHPGNMTLQLSYRYRLQGAPNWQGWSTPINSIPGTNVLTFTQSITNVRLFQYRVDMTTAVSNSSPLLDWIDVYYEVGDPEVAVVKDTGSVVTVTNESDIEYTIYYTNNGQWVAENVVLTETLPENTLYAGSGWHQVGASDIYTYPLGNLGRRANGSVTFRAQVASETPPGVQRITDTVEIGFPPMTDAISQTIVDPVPGNNSSTFSNPFIPYMVKIAKDSMPMPGAVVTPGQIITYSLTYSNSEGVFPAINAYILDAPPEHTTYLPGSIYGPGADDSNPALLRWNVGVITPNHTSEVGFAVVVSSALAEDTVLINTATIHSSSGPDRNSNTVSHDVIVPTYILEVRKDAMPPPGSEIAPSARLTYTIAYSNTGLLGASAAVLTDTYDPHESYTIVSTDPPADVGENVWRLGHLAPGSGGEIQVVVQLADTLPNHWIVSNQASLQSASAPVVFTDAVTHEVVFTGEDLPDLTVQDLRWAPAAPQPGEQPVDFYATIANIGAADAVSVWFGVELYIKAHPSAPPAEPSDHDEGYCKNGCATERPEYFLWEKLAQGDSKEISFHITDPPFPTDGCYDIYVQIDVAFEGDNWWWGKYREDYEYNNIASYKNLCVSAVGPPTVYLPAIYKSWP